MEAMTTKLFVGGIPYETTREELTELFSACGTVAEVTLIMDGQTGRTKGFGFVEMATEAEAQAAIAKLHGTNFGLRQLAVSEAKPQEKRPEVMPGTPGFVERRSGLKDRRRQQPANPADSRPSPDAPRREGSGSNKKRWGKPERSVRKPKDFAGKKKRGGQHPRTRRNGRRPPKRR
jgi:RNA recognition motif-containing protein